MFKMILHKTTHYNSAQDDSSMYDQIHNKRKNQNLVAYIHVQFIYRSIIGIQVETERVNIFNLSWHAANFTQ